MFEVVHRTRSLEPGPLAADELKADFIVLTGPNGAGKSNLLEGIKEQRIRIVDLGDLPSEAVRLFRLGELLAATEGPVQGTQYKEPWAGFYNNVLQWRDQARNNPNIGTTDAAREGWIENIAVQNRMITRAGLDRMMAESGKVLLAMDEADFKRYAPIIAGVKDPFSTSVAEIFLSYAQRYTENDRAQWRLERKGVGSALTDDEFYQRFGRPPWEVLNELLHLVGLDYKFNEPPDTDTTLYEVGLVHGSGAPLTLADLSSGEKVLLVVALSLFAGSDLDEAIELPRVLLLDEADASLHPSMVKSLLRVLEEIFVKQYGVRVILTTHSPTTVALAPEGSLFVMSRSAPRLRRVSTDEALKLLTVGMTTLSVSVENRRQVFVESEYDQAVYQKLFGLIRPHIETLRTPEFIPAAIGNSGGGCDEVKRLVGQLYRSGNSLVRGVVDRDSRGGAPEQIFYLEDRYAIENAVLDPLLLGAFLLRSGIVRPSELGLSEGLRHFELKAEHGCAISRQVGRRLGFSGEMASSRYAGGFEVDIPVEFLEMVGHDLERLVTARFPPLRVHGKKLKLEIVDKAVMDVPRFTPLSVLTLFEKLLAD